jgi:hypothetical protein
MRSGSDSSWTRSASSLAFAPASGHRTAWPPSDAPHRSPAYRSKGQPIQILSLILTISPSRTVRLQPCHGAHPKHPKATEATDTPTKSYAKPYSPPPTAHHAYAADSRCCQARNSTSTTTTTTAPNSEASRMPCATFGLQPRKHGRYSSQQSQGPAGQCTAGKARTGGTFTARSLPKYRDREREALGCCLENCAACSVGISGTTAGTPRSTKRSGPANGAGSSEDRLNICLKPDANGGMGLLGHGRARLTAPFQPISIAIAR